MDFDQTLVELNKIYARLQEMQEQVDQFSNKLEDIIVDMRDKLGLDTEDLDDNDIDE